MSLPSWERGLKLPSRLRPVMLATVAPLVGARIEIKSGLSIDPPFKVAPLVGARIEIARWWWLCRSRNVAPLVGARIEIRCLRIPWVRSSRRSPRGSAD